MVTRGQLRIYLGAAPGVGKTYAMLDEGTRRRSRGTDVVIGFVETHGRAATEAQIGELPIIARQHVAYHGQLLEEMDLAAVLARRPAVALVDEMAHTNVPGAGNDKRWQDVEVLLDAGITVISTLNIQHLESLNDAVARITGVVQRETIPDSVVRAADQVQFRQGNLAALRELALLWAAGQAEQELISYRAQHGIKELWETKERLVVGLAGASSEDNLIRRASRMGARLGSTVIGVHVRTAEGLIQREPEALGSHRRLLAELGGRYAEVTGTDIGSALLNFARAENATQLVVGASGRSAWRQLLRPPAINRIVRESGPIDVHVISLPEARDSDLPESPGRYRPASVPPHRRAAGWALGTVGIALVSVGLSPLRGTLGLPGALLCLLLVVVIVATIGGVPPAFAATLIAALAADYFFVPPIHSLLINRRGRRGRAGRVLRRRGTGQRTGGPADPPRPADGSRARRKPGAGAAGRRIGVADRTAPAAARR
jgi:two-component system sensor histidine kinase KdpD